MVKSGSSFEYVTQNELCLGCGACKLVTGEGKISFGLSSDGFLRPTLKEQLSSAEDGAFGAVCPGLKVVHKNKGDSWNDLWGPIISCNVGWAADNDVRYSASSGGGITATLIYLLRRKLVDAVLHVGVSDDDPLENVARISTTENEVRRNSGSRYAPAAPLLALNEAVERYERIALVGKPCDIVAARNLASVSPEIKSSIKYYISFMCAGVPSMKGTDAVLERLGAPKQEVKVFRYRGNGWPGYATATLNSGESRQMTYHDSWGKILNKHLQVRCKVCIDGTGEFADVTFADAWYGSDSGYPEFEEREGRSLIIGRTTVGQNLLTEANKAGVLQLEALSVNEIVKMQPYQAVRKRLMLSRVLAMKIMGLKPPLYDYANMVALAKTVGVKENIVSFLGMARRAMALKKRKR